MELCAQAYGTTLILRSKHEGDCDCGQAFVPKSGDGVPILRGEVSSVLPAAPRPRRLRACVCWAALTPSVSGAGVLDRQRRPGLHIRRRLLPQLRTLGGGWGLGVPRRRPCSARRRISASQNRRRVCVQVCGTSCARLAMETSAAVMSRGVRRLAVCGAAVTHWRVRWQDGGGCGNAAVDPRRAGGARSRGERPA
eukprot:1593213-Rhodomonas_salina.1